MRSQTTCLCLTFSFAMYVHVCKFLSWLRKCLVKEAQEAIGGRFPLRCSMGRFNFIFVNLPYLESETIWKSDYENMKLLDDRLIKVVNRGKIWQFN